MRDPNKCFAHTTDIDENGVEYETCRALKHQHYIENKENGTCDNFGCVFFKPAEFENCVRIGNEIFQIVDEPEND
jgi:hypothetical protein